jgi:hypothetical protein
MEKIVRRDMAHRQRPVGRIAGRTPVSGIFCHPGREMYTL